MAKTWQQYQEILHSLSTLRNNLMLITKNRSLSTSPKLWATRPFASRILPDGEVESILPKITNTSIIDDGFKFAQNYPNPFNPVTNLSFSLPYDTHVRLDIYNILGQRVMTLADDYYAAGNHTISWDGTDADGDALSAGIYFSRFEACDYVSHKKLLLLK